MKTEIEVLEFEEGQLEMITRLASQGFSPSEIAVFIKVKKARFLNFWKIEDHPVRVAYDRGLLVIKAAKAEALERNIRAGSTTALQIHDKKQRAQSFESIKQSIFNFG